MNDLPKRKTIRIPGYNYSQNGVYFVTICSADHKCVFGKVECPPTVGAIHESPATKLSSYGEIIDSCINLLPERFNIEINNYVIMPNHVHLLITIDDDNPENQFERAIRESPLQPRSTLSKVIGFLKINSSKEIHNRHPDLKVWQRSYYEHIIRNEKDYLIYYEYILNNPIKWETDDYYVN